jgi:tetratricopeptide (TPR) repeat protein
LRGWIQQSIERALTIYERVLPPDHPTIADSLSNLAGVLWAQRDQAGARRYLERALAIYERVLPPDHPTIADRLINLAEVLWSQGDLVATRR